MEVLKLLNELEDLVENSSSIPFSGKVLLDRNEVIELIKEIRIMLPDEVKQAQWIKEERSKILHDAQKEAEEIINNAKEHINEMVNRDKIVELAQRKSEEIINMAEMEAKEIKLASLEYVDNILKKLEEEIDQIKGTVIKNREELKEYSVS